MTYYCNECERDISNEVYRYSKDKFKRPLCMTCQKRESAHSASISNKSDDNPQSTPEARALYAALKARDVPAKLEKWDGYKHIDIAVPEAMVNIEVDGAHHNFDKKQALADLKRTFFSFKKGYVTLRIPNELVRNHLQETADYITEFLNASIDQIDDDY